MGEECQPRKQTKQQVLQKFLTYLRNRGDVQVDNDELISGLTEHFRLLPTRYALDVTTESLDILNHFNLLRESRRDKAAVFFHVRPVEVLMNEAYIPQSSLSKNPVVSVESSEPQNIPLSSKLPKPAFGSSPCLQMLAVESPGAGGGGGGDDGMLSSEAYVPVWFWEVTVASVDQPKFLSKLTDALGDVGLSIREAHVFNTADGMALDVFVTDGWEIDAKDGLEQSLGQRFSQLSPPPAMPAIQECAPSFIPQEIDQQQPFQPLIQNAQPSDWDIDINQLNVEARIGQGQFGTLYKGSYCSQSVAIKILKDVNTNTQQYQEFVQEVAIMRKVRHKNVVQFIGACTQKPNLCILFEFMSGGSLFDYLKRHGPLSLKQTLKVALDVARGMDYLHQMGIIHRDLKSSNLLLDENFVIKIGDFGVARVMSNDGVMTAETGTYRWMAPEIVEHKPYGPKADVFSFGIVLWELMTAKIPYDNMTPLQAAVGVVQKGMRPSLPDKSPEQLNQVINACWQQQPDKRPSFTQLQPVLKQMYQQVLQEETDQQQPQMQVQKEGLGKRSQNQGILGFRRLLQKDSN